MVIPGSGLVNNNTNINVNAGAGSVVNVEVINANTFGAALFPAGGLNMFGGDSPYLYPALLPSFLGAPRIDLLSGVPAAPAPVSANPQPVAAPDGERRNPHGCDKPHKAHHHCTGD